MQGKIVKGIAGFFYVYTQDNNLYECKGKGIFRKTNTKLLVGDNVEIDIIDEKTKKGNIIRLFERKNTLIRPSLSNIDRALILFSITKPEPNFELLNKCIIFMEKQNVPVSICFNKIDYTTKSDIDHIKSIYEATKYNMYFISVKENTGVKELELQMQGETTALAGPSGVGKSSFLNSVKGEIKMEIGEISKKLKRGKHTTRHSEIFCINNDTYIVDTPGFTSLDILGIDHGNLKEYFVEFLKYEDECKFSGCSHIHEPICGVKEAVNNKEISIERYRSYIKIYNEIKNNRR